MQKKRETLAVSPPHLNFLQTSNFQNGEMWSGEGARRITIGNAIIARLVPRSASLDLAIF